MEILQALLVGLFLGFVFIMLKLPIPAPPTLAGVAGIVGITLAFILNNYL